MIHVDLVPCSIPDLKLDPIQDGFILLKAENHSDESFGRPPNKNKTKVTWNETACVLWSETGRYRFDPRSLFPSLFTSLWPSPHSRWHAYTIQHGGHTLLRLRPQHNHWPIHDTHEQGRDQSNQRQTKNINLGEPSVFAESLGIVSVPARKTSKKEGNPITHYEEAN